MESAAERQELELAVLVANTRMTWLCTMQLLLENGLITEGDVGRMRERLLGAAHNFAASAGARKHAFGSQSVKDLDGLFRAVMRT